jgi:hypothetical protein
MQAQMLLETAAMEQRQQFLVLVLRMLVEGLAVKMLAQAVLVVQVAVHLHRQQAIQQVIQVLQTQVVALQAVMPMLLIKMAEPEAPVLLSSSTP